MAQLQITGTAHFGIEIFGIDISRSQDSPFQNTFDLPSANAPITIAVPSPVAGVTLALKVSFDGNDVEIELSVDGIVLHVLAISLHSIEAHPAKFKLAALGDHVEGTITYAPETFDAAAMHFEGQEQQAAQEQGHVETFNHEPAFHG